MKTLVRIDKEIVVRSDVLIVDVNGYRRSTLTVASDTAVSYVLVWNKIHSRSVTIHLKKGSSFRLSGIIVGSGSSESRLDITVIHEQPRSTSTVRLRGLFGGMAYGKMSGTTRIAKKATGSNARLEERVLLLSNDARAEAIPNLEILTDDVHAGHSATVSALSEDELFYLASRGLSRKQASTLIIRGFIADTLQHLPDSDVHDRVEAMILKSLGL